MACERLVALGRATAGKDELRAAIVDANGAIAARSLAEPHLLGMGTTLTSALIRDGTMILGHVGDSRAYLLHEGALRQLTDDHSWVGEMVRRGELTAAEAAVHPHRSVITRALGTEGEPTPDLLEIRLEPGDRLLLCSDGLSGMVSDETIQEVLRQPDGPQAVADALVQAALEGGGEDNVTVVVVDVVCRRAEPASRREAAKHIAERRHRDDVWGRQTGERNDLVGARLHAARSGDGRQAGPAPSYLGPADAQMPRRRLRAKPSPASLVAPHLDRHGGRRRGRTRRWPSRLSRSFNSNVYYVGTADGMVALYQGLPTTLLGIQLSSVVELGTSATTRLPHTSGRGWTRTIWSERTRARPFCGGWLRYSERP